MIECTDSLKDRMVYLTKHEDSGYCQNLDYQRDEKERKRYLHYHCI